MPALRLTPHSSVGLLAPSGFARAAIKTGDIPAAVGSRRPATTRSWARISARLDRRGRRLNGLTMELVIVDNESAPEGSGANDQITTIESRPVFLYLTVEKNLASGADDPQLLATGRAPSWRAPLIVFDESSLGLVPTIQGTTFGIDDIRDRARRSRWSSRTRTSRSRLPIGYAMQTGRILLAGTLHGQRSRSWADNRPFPLWRSMAPALH